MSIMYCNFNMFELKSDVLSIDEENNTTIIYTDTFDKICEFMSEAYQTHNYEKIVLAGPYAIALEGHIRGYSRAKYGKDDEINIEVIN